MAKDSSVETKAKEVVRQAIAALKARGFDINAYSVSLEARLPRWFIANNPTLMHLVAEARILPDSNGSAGTEDLSQKVQRLAKEIDESAWENSVLRRYYQESKNDNQALKEFISRTQQELEHVKQESQSNAAHVQLAWQQGFIAGQQSVLNEQTRTTSDTSLVIAQQATAYGAHSALTADRQNQAAQTLITTEHITAFVADNPLHIEDPAVLNDPFTAKLLNALQSEELHEAAVPAEPMQASGDGEPEFVFDESSSSAAPVHAQACVAQPSDLQAAGEGRFSQQDLMDESALEEPEYGDNDITSRFTAEELHNLFQNRYVKHDEPPEVQRTTTVEAPQQAKKFVGGKHPASNEPLPAMTRVIPPDIRKACKLLGVNPDEAVSRNLVLEAWKREMAKPGVHPDTGGDTEMAIYLNTAKDTLMRWVENQTPKLGKKFGQQTKTNESTKPPRKAE